MELNDYKKMYRKMNLSEEMDKRLKNRIKEEQMNMRRFKFKKMAAAAAFAFLAVAGGVSVYAATGNSSLLSFFAGDSNEVKNRAAELLETNVAQESGDSKKQSDFASFHIRQAVCDKNRVLIQVAVKAADAGKYLLIPQDCIPEQDPVGDLSMKGADMDENMTVKEYAESMGKKCLRVSASVDNRSGSQSIYNTMEEDGTLVYTISFQNMEKSETLDYTCFTCVYPPEGEGSEEGLKAELPFTLTDKSDVETIMYRPISGKNAAGTNLVVDEVVFEKSDLEMACYVKYHYVGSNKEWMKTVDADILFYMLDKNGEIIDFKSGEGTQIDGTKAVQLANYPLQELPDTISFMAKDVFEKKVYGTVDVKLVK